MKVILLEDVKNLGKAGETHKVSEGYGRNFLLPKKLAVVATPGALKRAEQTTNSKKGREKRVRLDAQYQAEQLSSQPVVITVAVGEGGKLFGSVTTADIEKVLAQRGVTVDKRKLELEEPIKTLGTYPVVLKLHPEVTATLTIVVQAEGAKVEPQPAEVPATEVSAEAPTPEPAETE